MIIKVIVAAIWSVLCWYLNRQFTVICYQWMECADINETYIQNNNKNRKITHFLRISKTHFCKFRIKFTNFYDKGHFTSSGKTKRDAHCPWSYYEVEMGRSSADAEVRPKNSAECSARFGSATCDYSAEVRPNFGKHSASFLASHLRRFALAAGVN